MGHHADDEIVEGSVARQVTTMSEKPEFEKDVESAGTKGNGAYTHIDEAVAARIAENVDDFMVSVNTLFLMNGRTMRGVVG